ncbi:MAG: radical SAM protein [Candidatus Micrarchaeota archaeon]
MSGNDFERFYQDFNETYSEILLHLTGQQETYPHVLFERFNGIVESCLRGWLVILDKLLATLRRLDGLNLSVENSGKVDALKGQLFELFMALKDCESGLPHLAPDFGQYLVNGMDIFSQIKEIEYSLRPLINEHTLKTTGLMIGGLNVSERCYARCPYCSVGAMPTHDVMDIGLAYDILQSEQVVFATKIHLGDGEILIHPDPEGLAKFIHTLICDYGIQVSFTTAGLLMQNEKFGRRFLRALDSLGAYASDLHAVVSFNFENLAARDDVSDYTSRVRDTFELLKAIGLQSAAINLLFDDCKDNTKYSNTISDLRRFLNHFIQGGRMDNLLVKSTGDALLNYEQDLSPDQLQKINLGVCPLLFLFNCEPSFRIRPDGSVSNFCLYPGTRGSTFGDIHINDQEQIRQGYLELTRVFEKLRGAREENKLITRCEFHRTMKWERNPPKSNRPIVERSRAIRC